LIKLIKDEVKLKEIKIRHFQLNDSWQANGVPSMSKMTFFNLIASVDKLESKHPIIVHGLFVLFLSFFISFLKIL
jgi:hypothetical protein